MRLLQQALLEGKQTAQQIAAVDRGNVAGLQRLQRPRVVPVVEVALEALQFFEGNEGLLQATEEGAQAEIAEVVRRQGREEQQSLIRRRGAVGDLAPGLFLKVVR